MNEEKLIWGAGFIDDDLVCEAIDYKPRRIRLAPWACAAAAAVVLVTAVAVLARQVGNSPMVPDLPSTSSTKLPEYTTGETPSSATNSSPEYTSSTDSAVTSATTVNIIDDPEPKPVDIGNGMTLTGTPLDKSELEEFSVESYFGGAYWSAEETFLDVLGIPELKDVYMRMEIMQGLLNTMSIKRVPAVTENGRAPARIKTADGGIYEELGYTYDSFYNAYLSAFTKEIAEEIFKEFNFFLNYNGALFCEDTAKGGMIGEVHREYKLLSKSDTVIEFRGIISYDRHFELEREYDPELSDEYDITYTDFKFVLTEDGWRAANIPKEIPQPVTPVTPTDGKNAYEKILEDYVPENPTTYGPPLTADEEMNDLISNPHYPEYDVDSYYLVEVIRALTNEEYMQMNGWIDSIGGSGFTVYEVKLVEDLISGEAPNRTEFIRIPAGFGARIQKLHDPAYAPGEKFTAVLTKPYKDNDFVISASDYCLRYDLTKLSDTDNYETMLYFRGNGQARQPIPDLPFDTEEINIEAAYSTPQNPATYIQKIALDDLVKFLRSEWEQRGISSHFDH